MDDAQRAAEVLRLADVYRQGCGNTAPLDRPPTDCAECTRDFLVRLSDLVGILRPPEQVERLRALSRRAMDGDQDAALEFLKEIAK